MADNYNMRERISKRLGSAAFDQTLERVIVATGAAFVASGPCAILMLALIQLLFGESPQLFLLKIVAWPPYGASVWIFAVFIAVHGAPTPLAIVATLEGLARYQLDSWTIALLCGAVVGLVVQLVALHVLYQGTFTQVDIVSAVVATAATMALLYWTIAIKSRRRSRCESLQSSALR